MSIYKQIMKYNKKLENYISIVFKHKNIHITNIKNEILYACKKHNYKLLLGRRNRKSNRCNITLRNKCETLVYYVGINKCTKQKFIRINNNYIRSLSIPFYGHCV